MATGKHMMHLSLVSAIDMSGTVRGTGVLYKAVTMAGNIASVGSGAAGLLQIGAKSGQNITVGWHGEGQYIASAAVVAHGLLAVTTSGYLGVPNSGDWVVGRNTEIAATSGSVARGTFDFAGAYQGLLARRCTLLPATSTPASFNSRQACSLPGPRRAGRHWRKSPESLRLALVASSRLAGISRLPTPGISFTRLPAPSLSAKRLRPRLPETQAEHSSPRSISSRLTGQRLLKT